MTAKLRGVLPQLAVAPSFALSLVFVYGFMLWTVRLSFTSSTMMPRFDSWTGLHQYARLWSLLRWHTAVENLFLYGGLYVAGCLALGLLMAIMMDSRIRAEGVLRTIFLYPMALSFIVTGTAWKWILDPELGLEKLVRAWGWKGFVFDWLVNPKLAIFTVALAGIWQSSGFVMALFLAGLRSVDQNLIRAAAIDGASLTQTYRRVILPALRPIFFSALVMLSQNAVKAFDIVIALTGGGPGFSSDLPATFMHAYAFQRSELGLASAGATMMLATVAAIIVPYLYSELGSSANA